MSSYKAVLFDLGGVVYDSPLIELLKYEKELDLPPLHFGKHMVFSDSWEQLETGRITAETFARRFEAEMKSQGVALAGDEFVKRLTQGINPRPWMLRVVATLRANGFKTCAVTNNWIYDNPRFTTIAPIIVPYFDYIVESAVEHTRKPDKPIYEIAVGKVGVPASACIFLDDIGRNLKVPKQMGMATIQVDKAKPKTCLLKLQELVHLPLIDESDLSESRPKL